MDYDYARQYNKYSSSELLISEVSAKRYLQELMPYLPDDKSGRILEIGPGNGRTMQLLLDMGYSSVSGLEVDKSLANTASNKGLNVQHILADQLIDRLFAEQGQYELIYCMHVIEHVAKEQQIDFVRSINTALKAEGYFFCETPNALSPVASYYRYNDWTHTISFTPVSLEFLLENANFLVVYSGNALDGPTPPRGGLLVSFLKDVAEVILKGISRGILRINYVAQFGFEGLNFPLMAHLMVIGKKI